MAKEKKSTINVQGTAITILSQKEDDFISLTDMANKFGGDDLIYNWMRNRNTVEFLGIWEQIHNPGFKGVEFDTFKKEAGLNSFRLTPKKWVEATDAIGIQSRAGRYGGGTYAHKDLAFEFGSWLSPEFKMYLIKEFQRLKEDENQRLSLAWNLNRTLAKINYRIHTDAIKENIIPQALIAQKEQSKKWLMQQLLTGKKRLKGFKEKWIDVHIMEVAKEVSLRNKEDKQLTVLSCTRYDGLVPSMEYFGRKILADDVSTYKVVPINHFAYATNHIEEGSIGYQEIFNEALISPMYTVFKTNDSVNDTFFYKLLKSHNLVFQYQNRMERSIDRRGGLRWDAFSIIKIRLPKKKEQTAIAQVLQAAAAEIQILKTKTERLREQKKGLMQQLLTGKKRLKLNHT